MHCPHQYLSTNPKNDARIKAEILKEMLTEM